MSGPVRVLNLVTNPDARCFEKQVRSLADLGVASDTLTPPGEHDVSGDVERHRSVVDYLRFYPTVLRHSFGDYDLLHANYGLTGPAAMAQPNLPFVLSLWGSDLYGRYGWLSRLCARRADAVIVMSESMATDLDQPCHVIPHGIDTGQFSPRPQQAAQAELSWDPDVHHVLFPYPPVREVKNYPRAKRVVAAARGRLEDSIALHPVVGVPHDQMSTYMNAADVLLLTSNHEGSPNTVKEAMACNLPVVSTDVGDVRERLDGVVPSAVGRSEPELVDALCTVLKRGERSNGREAVGDLTEEWTARRIHEVYRGLLDGSSIQQEPPDVESIADGYNEELQAG